MLMELIDVIKSRRSIRKFKQEPVPDAYITELLEAARLAPSGSNLQPTRYVVVKSEGAKAKLQECTLMPVTKFPVIIVCCIDSQASATAKERREELISVGAFKDLPVDFLNKFEQYQRNRTIDEATAKASGWLNAAIAIDHITLRATDLGLGSCWIGLIDRQKTKKILEIDDRYDVVAWLAIGFPDQCPPSRPRLPIDKILLKEL